MQKGLKLWHEYVEAGDPALLPAMFTEDCVFISPVVHTPQRGRDITVLYLSGAMYVLGNGFRYLKEIVTDTHAALEF
ncbi:MAG: nuclear transport factor 2 family protein, partial [Pseudomonadota bacterium]